MKFSNRVSHRLSLLVPNAQDGVPYLTIPPIPAKGMHTFKFKLIHPGTYWYHSHTELQEQRGVYGSIEYDTNTELEWAAGASYLLNKEFSLTTSYQNEHGWGAGLSFRF